MAADIAGIMIQTNLPLKPPLPSNEEIAYWLNQAALTYFVSARTNTASSPFDLEKWCEKVRKASVGALKALGVEDLETPTKAAPLGAIHALFPDMDCVSARQVPPELGLPAHFFDAIHVAVGGLWFIHHRASAAVHIHASRKRQRPVKPHTARQALVAALGEIYRRLFGRQIPRRGGNADLENNPFARFASAVMKIIADRVVPPKPQLTLPSDGFDYKSAKALRAIGAQQISDDLRRAVSGLLRIPAGALGRRGPEGTG